ncbi:hydroxymethylbilane synthase [Listeria costaricensis]|uniref:hydroxymethylbilane synthase n=1 Tax=Listeria costaricensis TaxID=2026604 RepID=UPI000C081DFA|nr:hydroxymethylbilane synthase [Listeria costaricensis]
MSRKIIVGSRKSKLALTQTNWVIQELKKKRPELEFQIYEIITKGDKILDVTLNKVGGKGLFVSEVETALQTGEIDFAVHSMKDVPAQLAAELTIGAIPKRESPFDCLVFDQVDHWDQLPSGAIIGTSSLRRAAQLQRLRPDFQIRSIRGNIDTRLKKLHEEAFDAIVLAEAGLARMGWLNHAKLKWASLPAEICLPAVGQGALAVECRETDLEIRQLLASIHDVETAFTVRAERAFLKRLDGGCEIPLAGFAEKHDTQVRLRGMVAEPESGTFYRTIKIGSDPEQVGVLAAEELLASGAEKVIRELKQND